MCVPLLGSSRLTQTSIIATSKLLENLINALDQIPSEDLTANLVAYVFLPLSTILQRNSSAEIPDQILEKILIALCFLAESWWWTCDIKIWEQMFMLCGSVVGGIETKSSAKTKSRDDETRQAAMKCLATLLRPRTAEEAIKRFLISTEAEDRLLELQEHTQNQRFIPIIGQTLDSVMSSASSRYLELQKTSLEVTCFLIDLYMPDSLIPSILPGTVSTMTKLCLGIPRGNGWTNGEVVTRALKVIEVVAVKAIGDEVCVKHGILRRVRNLDDFISNVGEGSEGPSLSEETNAFGTRRTESWLRGTATQLHIAINSLTPLPAHPTPAALHALCTFSSALIQSTPLTLPQTQPLLLSFLLSLSLSEYSSVSSQATNSLVSLLTTPSDAQLPLQTVLLTNLGDNLSSLPRLLSIQSDARVAHTAGLVVAICQLAFTEDSRIRLPAISKGIGQLLGPSGGIEKWGWGLLSVLEFVEPPVVVTQTSGAQLSLENDPDAPFWVAFPELVFKNISSHETRDILKKMFQSLGKAGGDSCIFAIDWFVSLGCASSSTTSVAALWCASRLLEGISGISIFEERAAEISSPRSSKRLEKHARSLAKTISETWDQIDTISASPDEENLHGQDDNSSLLVQHQKGLIPLQDTLKITQASGTPKPLRRNYQPIIHKALSLQIIAVAAGIAQNRFSSSFIHTLYPVLHSIVSPVSFLSSTGLATLNFITVSTSYASPANLLLSNFDYILDSISRRLTQRWLDIDASKVLGLMVRLVGSDIVDKAGDVVEECFDRLDEFHGYGVIVDGLIEVLAEVVKVIETEAQATANHDLRSTKNRSTGAQRVSLDALFAFLPRRFDDPSQEDTTNYGTAPREPWGKPSSPEDGDQDGSEDEHTKVDVAPSDEPPPTPVQALTTQIISRSMYFLTHDSPVIRARILNLLASSVPVLPESALLPSIHPAWPFILNRLGDSETFVVSAAAGLIEALSSHVGDFMFRKIWDDVWPRFRSMLSELEKGEKMSALTRSNKGKIGPESAYTHSHRLYRSLIRTMIFALKSVHEHEPSFWEILMLFRRFLSGQVHEELQKCAVELYNQAAKINPDAVWLILVSTTTEISPIMDFMVKPGWYMESNRDAVLKNME